MIPGPAIEKADPARGREGRIEGILRQQERRYREHLQDTDVGAGLLGSNAAGLTVRGGARRRRRPHREEARR